MQIEALQDEFEIAAIDLPGYNASDKPTARSAYVTTNLCALIAGAVHALGRSQCTVVGHDWGGVLSWDLAALYPELVERLVVLAAPHPRLFAHNMDAGQQKRSRYILAFQQPWIAEALLRASDYRFLNVLKDRSKGGCVRHECSDEEIDHYKDAAAQRGALTAMLNYYRASVVESQMLGMNKEADVARRRKLEMPVMLLWADRDMALSLNLLEGIGSIATRISVHVIPDCSHWMQMDAPDVVNRLIICFMHDELPVTSRL